MFASTIFNMFSKSPILINSLTREIKRLRVLSKEFKIRFYFFDDDSLSDDCYVESFVYSGCSRILRSELKNKKLFYMCCFPEFCTLY